MKFRFCLVLLMVFSTSGYVHAADGAGSALLTAIRGADVTDNGKGPGDMNQETGNEPANEEPLQIADPLESFNRAMFVFNDKLYFWVLKPVARGYNAVAPEPVRIGVRNFFSNVRFPIRFVNCLLQADLKGAAVETGRFGINTTVGILGFMDPASGRKINLQKQETDLGLTLGTYGMGQGFFIEWPFIGPSSARDTLGTAGDYFLDPVSYVQPLAASIGIRSYEMINATSLKIGDYESLKEASIDPYLSVRDAYLQYRENRLKGRDTGIMEKK